MKIIINNKSQNIEITCFDNLEHIHDNLKKFPLIKCDLEVKFFAIDEKISSHRLSNLKKVFEKLNIYSLRLYSNDRDTILAGKSLKIDSIYLKEKELRAKFNLYDSKKK